VSDLVFVDTSVWIDALRGRPESTVRELQALIDEDRVVLPAPVRLEVLSGASREQLRRLLDDLSALPTFYPTTATWTEIESWIEVAVGAGERFGIGDLLIAAIAAEQGGEVWSEDGDFRRLHRLGFIELFEPSRRSEERSR
jgi:predicted nucleic acid-binding protein